MYACCLGAEQIEDIRDWNTAKSSQTSGLRALFVAVRVYYTSHVGSVGHFNLMCIIFAYLSNKIEQGILLVGTYRNTRTRAMHRLLCKNYLLYNYFHLVLWFYPRYSF